MHNPVQRIIKNGSAYIYGFLLENMKLLTEDNLTIEHLINEQGDFHKDLSFGGDESRQYVVACLIHRLVKDGRITADKLNAVHNTLRINILAFNELNDELTG